MADKTLSPLPVLLDIVFGQRLVMLSIVSPTVPDANVRLHKSGDGHSSIDLGMELRRGALRQIAPKENVFVAGAPRSSLYRVERGMVCLYKLATNGQRQIIRFASPGDFLGLGTAQDHLFGAQAIQEVCVRYVSITALSHMIKAHPELAGQLYRALSDELTSLQDHLLVIGQKTALERVAYFLIDIARRDPPKDIDEEPQTLNLPMTRQDMGDFLGLTLETVSRALTKLRLKHLIDFRHGSRITLLDKAKLEDLADIR
jgi:CRP/FNR family transcriptional regulator, anaerobic regulatory protein